MASSTPRDVPDNWRADSIPSLKGKTAVVTGGNSGIGFEAALQLAKHGAHVILACRNASKAEEAAARIRSEAGADAGQVETMTLDVSSQQSVRAFADNFKQAHDKLHLLINNAGVMAVPLSLTVDGHERQFATNHLGHFALTALLFESLKKAAPDARVINVSSLAHRNCNGIVPREQIMVTDESKYSANGTYSQSKLYNLLFSMELSRRMDAAGISGVKAITCHPGFTRTNITLSSAESGWLVGTFFKILNALPIWQDAATGALPTLYAAVGSNVESGDYYGPGGFQAMRGSPKLEQPAKAALSEEFAKALWEESEKLSNIKFDIK